MKYSDLLTSPTPTRAEIQKYVPNATWQKLRGSLHGISTQAKLKALRAFKKAHNGRWVDVVVHNYITALKRGGLLK